MRRRILDWLEHRTGIETAVKNFLYEDIPASSGWHQVFGSVALFLFFVQAFTGILLAFNYAPTPGEAYYSLRYIITELTGGRMIRGLHHWGASMMIVVVGLHMAQVFLFGAYKKPREATWMLGVVLLLLVLAYGLTGYLLPWDNRAYWGTVVATQIAGQAPLFGPYLQRLLGSEGGAVGAVTFARFYALHVLLLPPITMLLIALHVYLVRKHGVAPQPEDQSRPARKFYPGQVFKDTVAIFVAFVILFTLAVTARVPLERLADPTDTSYIPRPEWYFLFLFQLLKLFEGPLEVIGSVILPTLAILALFLVPFVDRAPMKRWRQRTLAMGVLALGVLAWGGLTAAAVVTTPKTIAQDFSEVSGPEAWQELSPVELAGIGYFRRENCGACHQPGGNDAPDLTKGTKRPPAWMIQHFKNPQMRPGSQMPPLQLTNRQLSALVAFLQKLNEHNYQQLLGAPPFAVEGAMLYHENNCGACHQVNGVGQKTGPALNGLASRRSRDWIEGHFLDPQKFSPGTTMPPYKFSSRDLDRITSYLLALP
jgi:ubiquinol-cytochrome c reductase cytochrome b subunit